MTHYKTAHILEILLKPHYTVEYRQAHEKEEWHICFFELHGTEATVYIKMNFDDETFV